MDREVEAKLLAAERFDALAASLGGKNHAAELEKFQWFVRAHLENAGGALTHEGKSTEKGAAKKAR